VVPEEEEAGAVSVVLAHVPVRVVPVLVPVAEEEDKDGYFESLRLQQTIPQRVISEKGKGRERL